MYKRWKLLISCSVLLVSAAGVSYADPGCRENANSAWDRTQAARNQAAQARWDELVRRSREGITSTGRASVRKGGQPEYPVVEHPTGQSNGFGKRPQARIIIV